MALFGGQVLTGKMRFTDNLIRGLVTFEQLLGETDVHTHTHLKLLHDLVDERNEVVEFAHVRVLQEAVHRDWNERQDVGVEADHHAMEELTDALVKCGSLDRNAQGRQKHAQGVDVNLRAAVQLHRLLARETLARPTADDKRNHFPVAFRRQCDKLKLAPVLNSSPNEILGYGPRSASRTHVAFG